MTGHLPPTLLELARRYYAGESDANALKAAIEAWNQAHPESPCALDDLLQAVRTNADGGGATRILQTRETASPSGNENDGRRIQTSNAPGSAQEEATRLMSGLAPSNTPLPGVPPVPEAASGTTGAASEDAATRLHSRQATAGTTEDSSSAPSREPEPGDRLKDRFVLESLLGRGGMGAVFKARDLRKEEAQDRDPWIAVKVLSGDFREHPAAFIALQREAKKAQKLAHPNTVTVYDFDRDASIVFMTMELLEGESLKDLLRRHPYGLPLRETLPIVEGIVSGLAYAHEKGIVHSDLKPGNIFITREGAVKVLDFGIARALHGSRLHDGVATAKEVPSDMRQAPTGGDATLFDPGTLGALTPAYASPEMLEGKDPDPRDDIYALACVTYELLTGRHPFQRLPADEARRRGLSPEPVAKIPRRTWKALQHGLAFEREARTATAQQFFVELSGRRPGRGMNPRLVALVLLLVLSSGVGLTLRFQSELEYFWHSLFPTELPAEVRAEIEDLLEIADLNREAGRLVSPPGSNAYEAYQAVLELDEWNTRARKGLDKIAEYLSAEGNRLYSTEQIEQARRLVDESLRYFPDHKGLQRLRRRLEQETESE